MNLISYPVIRAFIMAQPDDKPINMYQGHLDSQSGCVLVHYAKDHGLTPGQYGCGFKSINNENQLEEMGQTLLQSLAPYHPSNVGESAQSNETYAVIKQRISEVEPKVFEAHHVESRGFIINNFTYDGFGGSLTGGNAPYTANFTRWTTDPGIAVMACSDGQDRLIPAWAIVGFDHKVMLSYQDTSAAKEMAERIGAHLGQPSTS